MQLLTVLCVALVSSDFVLSSDIDPPILGPSRDDLMRDEIFMKRDGSGDEDNREFGATESLNLDGDDADDKVKTENGLASSESITGSNDTDDIFIPREPTTAASLLESPAPKSIPGDEKLNSDSDGDDDGGDDLGSGNPDATDAPLISPPSPDTGIDANAGGNGGNGSTGENGGDGKDGDRGENGVTRVSTPSGTISPVDPEDPPAYFRVSLNVTSERCSSALLNRSSNEYLAFQQRFERAVLSIIDFFPGSQTVNVVQIRCGSLVVQFDIGSVGFNDGDRIDAELKEALRQGRIGEFFISPISYSFAELGVAPPLVVTQPPSCQRLEFQCASGDCIASSQRCDGVLDCADGSDEQNCAVPCDKDREIDCGDDVCIELDRRCDGRRDCASGRDEENCESLITVAVDPREVRVNEGSRTAITCQAKCPLAIPCDVAWGYNRVQGLLPEGVVARGTRLDIQKALPSHAGIYYCSVVNYPQASTDSAELIIDRAIRPLPPPCDFDEYTCSNLRCVSRERLCDGADDCRDNSDEANCISADQCEPPEFRCRNGNCVQKIWRCDGDDDCKDGTDEERIYCPAKGADDNCNLHEFMCESRDQCLPKSYLCDGQKDCNDNSDEIGCVAPTITAVARPQNLTVREGDTIRLDCTAIGKPVPLISWRLNWGNIPIGDRVQEINTNGYGVLEIRDAQVSDSGAYSCEAINIKNSVFANPDAIVRVLPRACPRGQFRAAEECLSCFCSGRTSGCGASGGVPVTREARAGVTLGHDKGVDITRAIFTYDTVTGEYAVPSYASDAPAGTLYWKLPSQFNGNQLGSYGATLHYTIRYETSSSRPLSAYDVIIRGKDLTISCTVSERKRPSVSNRLQLQLREKSCTKEDVSSGDISIPDVVSRADMLRVLSNVQYMLIRATYDSRHTLTAISDIRLETNPAMVEVCDCPRDYKGSSCEEVQSQCKCNGHSDQCDRSVNAKCLNCLHNTEGDRCERCRPPYVGDATRGTPQDCRLPSNRCNPAGTLREERGGCVCKDFVTGPLCDQCKANTFALTGSQSGCSECFCMGITQDCTSTRLRRLVISASADLDSWSLTNSAGTAVIASDVAVLSVDGTDEEVIADFSPSSEGPYYWRLPDVFLGNQLSAYGGQLRFRTKFVTPSVEQPSSNDLDIILFGGNGIQLNAPFKDILLDSRAYDGEITLHESHWRRADGGAVTREHMLMALEDIQAILIKASFTTNTEQSRISNVNLNVASDRAPSNAPIAFEVEQCNCPTGYQGLSCEKCAPGYTRSFGLYLGICIRSNCNCNGHSDQCDDRGTCLNCQHGTTGRFCENCLPGFERNARDGSIFECLQPARIVIIERPEITVTVRSSAELVCKPFDSNLPYRSIVWRRVDNRPLPPTQRQSDGRLIIDNVQPAYSGRYVCELITSGGVIGNGITSLVVVGGEVCPRGYSNPPLCNACAPGFTRDSSDRCIEVSDITVTITPSGSQTVNEGGDVQFECVARSQVGNILYVVAWSKDGSRLPASATEQDGVLTITRASVSDSGTYTCTGSNRAFIQTASVSLRVVRREPELVVSTEPDKLYIQEGASGVLRCVVSGNARSVSWQGPGVDRSSKNQMSSSRISGDTLTFVNMAVADRGYYYCTVTGADAITTVTSSPALVDFQRGSPQQNTSTVIRINTPDVVVKERESARLVCTAESSASVRSITWAREDSIRDPRFVQSNGVLTIRDARAEDSGLFICTVILTNNQVQTGRARLSVEQDERENLIVSVFGPDRSDRLELREGDSGQLVCEITGGEDAATITWQRVGAELDTNVRISGRVLRFISATSRNDGRYRCIVKAVVGTNTADGFVQVTPLGVTPRPVFSPLPEKVDAPIGSKVELTCSVPPVAGGIQPMVYWRNWRGQRLTESRPLDATIVLDPVTFSNAGNYTCVAEIPGASSSQSFLLRVIIPRTGPIIWDENPKMFIGRVGDSVTFDCKPTTSLATSTEWRRDDQADLPAGAVTRGSRLEFGRLRATDAGVYVCKAKSSLGSAELYTVLTVEGPPGNPVVSADGTRLAPNGVKLYEAGSHVTLTCLADGSPTPRYEWSKMLSQGGFQRLVSGGNIQINDGILSFGGSELIITNVRKADSGYYNCTAINSQGAREVFVRLNIPSDSVVPQNISVRSSGDGSQRNLYKTGQTAVLRCTATSPTLVSYSWTFSNGPLPRNAVLSGAVLSIENLSAANQGTYYCTATNDAGASRPAAAEVYVSGVPAAPQPSITTFSQRLRQNLKMQCPLPNGADSIEWVRDGGKALPASSRLSSRGQILEIFNLQTDDAGTYYCYAINTAGWSTRVPVYVTVSGGGVQPQPTKVQDVEEGSQVVVTCSKPANSIRTTWSRENNLPLPSQSYEEGDTLVIPRIRIVDGGTYYCIATSSNGQTASSSGAIINVQATSRPEIETPVVARGATTSHRVPAGSDLELSCVPIDPENVVLWSRLDSTPLPVNSRVISNSLVIRNVQPSDEGTYECRARNRVGMSEPLEHRIIVESVPEQPLPTPVITGPVAAKIGDTFDLQCRSQQRDVRYTWSRTQGGLPSTSRTAGQTLRLSNFQARDGGVYTCTATSPGGSSFATHQVVAQSSVSAIEITASPSRIPAVGSTVQLTCRASGEDITYQWSRGDGQRLPATSTQRQGILQIRDFRDSYQGAYECTASSPTGSSQSATVTLNIFQEEAGKPLDPSIQLIGSQVYGESLRMVCSCKAVEPGVHLSIWRDGIMLARSDRNHTSVELVFESLVDADSGTYVCEAVDAAGRKSSTTSNLTVSSPDGKPPAPPVIRPSDAVVFLGETVTFECGAIDAIMYHWEKVSGELPEKVIVKFDVIQIPNVTAADMGEYRCVALNDAGRDETVAMIRVRETTPAITEKTPPAVTEEAPVIRVSADAILTSGDAYLISIPIKENVTILECLVDGSGPISYTWIDGSGTILSKESSLTVSVDSATHPIYTCRVENNVGSDTKAWRVVRGAFIPGFVADSQYLELDPVNDAYLTTTLEISIKPTESSGLLLYSGPADKDDGSSDFIALGLTEGTPVFRFNLGSKVEEISGKTTIPLNKVSTVKVIRNKKDVTLVVNEESTEITSTGSMTGLNLDQPLYLGGAPTSSVDDSAGFGQPFQGIVTRLLVQDELITFSPGEAEQNGVQSANTCSEQPCLNKGVCVTSATAEGYECICAKGWAGSTCAVTGEACHPGYCANHGACSNTEMGPQCFCKLGFSGKICEIDLQIEYPSFSSNSYIAYAPLTDVSRSTIVTIALKAAEVKDGVVLYVGENQFGSGDYFALLLRDGYLVLTFDLGAGAGVLRSSEKLEAGKWYKVEAERMNAEGSLVIDGGVAVKASVGRRTTTTTTAAPVRGGWLFGNAATTKPPLDEEGTEAATSIGLNVKTPLFVGGVDPSFVLPESLRGLSGFIGCISKVSVNQRDIDLIRDAEDHSMVSSCNSDDVQNDDPCLKIPCANRGICLAKSSNDFMCTCLPGFTGKYCEQELNACTLAGQSPCLNGGMCEALDEDRYKCKCIMGWTGKHCEQGDRHNISYAHGKKESYAVPELILHDFVLDSQFMANQNNESATLVTPPRSVFRDATRPSDFFKYYLARLKGAKENDITSGDRVCVGGSGYLELPRQLLPSSTSTMKLQFTLQTNSSHGVIFWQGQQSELSGIGEDFFAVGLQNGFIKFSFELGGGPAVLISASPVNDGKSHSIVVERYGQDGSLKVDEEVKVTGKSGGSMKQLNGNGNIYLGGVPNYQRMVGNSYKPSFRGCISDMRTSAVNGAVDLFQQKISGIDITNQ